MSRAKKSEPKLVKEKDIVDSLGRPSWKYRRRLIFGSFYLAVFMILFATGTFFFDSRVLSELVIGGVTLISIILTAYIAGATVEDVNLWDKHKDPQGSDEVEL
jgi:hypothetical protein